MNKNTLMTHCDNSVLGDGFYFTNKYMLYYYNFNENYKNGKLEYHQFYFYFIMSLKQNI